MTSAPEPYGLDEFRADRSQYGFTATSYAVLGLVSLREWTTYELAQQMKRSFSYFWPRAERRIYDEPKRLAEAGYAEAQREMVGRRPRTCWSITARGRDALRHWLGEPSTTPLTMEFEGMLKIFLSENGTKAQLLDNLQAVRVEALERRGKLAEMSAEIAADDGRFPGREHVNALTMDYMVAVSELTARWAEDAARTVETWPDTAAPGSEAYAAARAAFARFAGDQRPN